MAQSLAKKILRVSMTMGRFPVFGLYVIDAFIFDRLLHVLIYCSSSSQY